MTVFNEITVLLDGRAGAVMMRYLASHVPRAGEIIDGSAHLLKDFDPEAYEQLSDKRTWVVKEVVTEVSAPGSPNDHRLRRKHDLAVTSGQGSAIKFIVHVAPLRGRYR